MKEKNKLNKFRFIHPYNVRHLPTQRTDKEYLDELLEKREIALTDRLGEIFPDEILLVSCNVGWYWILTVIDMKKDIVYLLDPFGPRHRSDDWKHVVDTAMKKLNKKNGKSLMSKTDWKLVKAPRQPDDVQCGYYVMAYMKHIIEDAFVDPGLIPSIFAKANYSWEDIDQVRTEWADSLSDLMED